MKKKQTIEIGVATAVASKYDYDLGKAIQLAHSGHFSLLQTYLTERWLHTPETLIALRKLADEYKIRCVLHAQPALNETLVTQLELLKNASDILCDASHRILIVHHDPTTDRNTIDQVVKFCVEQHIILALENYFRPGSGEADSMLFLDLMTHLKDHSGNFTVVLDLPRFVNSAYISPSEGVRLYNEILHTCISHDISVILHLIDSFSDVQSDRTTWCMLGEGIIPLQSMIRSAREINLRITHVIMEYEKITHCKLSKYRLHSWLRP